MATHLEYMAEVVADVLFPGERRARPLDWIEHRDAAHKAMVEYMERHRIEVSYIPEGQLTLADLETLSRRATDNFHCVRCQAELERASGSLMNGALLRVRHTCALRQWRP